MSVLHQTPLTEWHMGHGAIMAPYYGWNMPMHYPAGALTEHHHTREKAGLFDLSHMGEFLLEGPGAADALARSVAANIATLKTGRCRYAFVLNERGGVKNDLIIYRLDTEKFMLVVNPHCTMDDFTVLRQSASGDLHFTDISATLGKIDLQGPKSFEVLDTVFPGPWKRLPYYGFVETTHNGIPLTVSRTGYTGELGVEIYCPHDAMQELWTALVADHRVLPAGIAARGTLRLEVGLPLYHQDLDQEHTPAEAGFASMLTSQAPYIGKDAAFTVATKLVPFFLEGDTPAQTGDAIHDSAGNHAGSITSSILSPSLNRVIALGYIDAECTLKQTFQVTTKNGGCTATSTTLPFYTQGTAKALLL